MPMTLLRRISLVLALIPLMSMTYWVTNTGMIQTVWAQGTQVSSTYDPAQEAEASKRVNRLSDQLKSPFCPGKTLLTCTSSQAFDLRKEMTQMILAGKSDAEIIEALRDKFGELENPPQPWYTILVPIMPFILGALIAVWMFSRWLRGSAQSEVEPASVGDTSNITDIHQDRLSALLKDED